MCCRPPSSVRGMSCMTHSAQVSRVGHIGRIAILLVEIRERQERRHGVDVLGRRAGGEPIAEPVLDDLQTTRIAGELEILLDAVQPDAVRPFPIVPALGVDDAAVVELQQEFAGSIFQIDQIGNQQLDGAMQARRVVVAKRNGHETYLQSR